MYSGYPITFCSFTFFYSQFTQFTSSGRFFHWATFPIHKAITSNLSYTLWQWIHLKGRNYNMFGNELVVENKIKMIILVELYVLKNVRKLWKLLQLWIIPVATKVHHHSNIHRENEFFVQVLDTVWYMLWGYVWSYIVQAIATYELN